MKTPALSPRWAWLSELTLRPHLLLVAGAGYLSPQPDPSAYASLAQIKQGAKPGRALRASCVLALRQGKELRYVLLQGDHDVPAGQAWQFPGAHCLQHELPLAAAVRALNQNVRVDGEPPGWGSADMDMSGAPFTYLRDGSLIESAGRLLLIENTVEFFYPVTLTVARWDAVQLSDASGKGRAVQLVHKSAVLGLAAQGKLSPSTQRFCEIAQSYDASTLSSDYRLPSRLETELLPLWEGAGVHGF